MEGKHTGDQLDAKSSRHGAILALARHTATKAHDWMVSHLGPLFRTAGRRMRTQHGVTASAGQKRENIACMDANGCVSVPVLVPYSL